MQTVLSNRSVFISLLLAIVLGGTVAFAQIPPPPAPTPSIGCRTLYNATTDIPSGYGAAYNLFSSLKELILNVTCSGNATTLTAGTPNATDTVVYKQGYKWVASQNQWAPLSLTGTPFNNSPDWLQGSAQANINANLIGSGSNYVVAYVCKAISGQWQCGCSNTSCTAHNWNLQAFDQSGASGTGGGGGTANQAPTLMMDPDGPDGPMQPQGGTVTSKLVSLGTGYYGKRGYHFGDSNDRVGALIGITGNMVADLSWTSGASSCSLQETMPAPGYTAPSSFSYPSDGHNHVQRVGPVSHLAEPIVFNFANLPASGRGTLALPVLPAYVTAKFMVTCGGQSSSLVATYDPSLYDPSSGNDVGYYTSFPQLSELLAQGFRILTTTTGPVRVDIKGADEKFSPNSHVLAFGHHDNPLIIYRDNGNYSCAALGAGTAIPCLSAAFWSAMNATQCDVAMNITNPRADSDSHYLYDNNQRVGVLTEFTPPLDARNYDKYTVTCANSSGETASDTALVQ